MARMGTWPPVRLVVLLMPRIAASKLRACVSRSAKDRGCELQQEAIMYVGSR